MRTKGEVRGSGHAQGKCCKVRCIRNRAPVSGSSCRRDFVQSAPAASTPSRHRWRASPHAWTPHSNIGTLARRTSAARPAPPAPRPIRADPSAEPREPLRSEVRCQEDQGLPVDVRNRVASCNAQPVAGAPLP
eukprot:scaffold267502_cov30-Tisochrysis_lutea.AAC.2